jgi:hypothetical protein
MEQLLGKELLTYILTGAGGTGAIGMIFIIWVYIRFRRVEDKASVMTTRVDTMKEEVRELKEKHDDCHTSVGTSIAVIQNNVEHIAEALKKLDGKLDIVIRNGRNATGSKR